MVIATSLYRVNSTTTTCLSCPSIAREHETISMGLWSAYSSYRRTLYQANCPKIRGTDNAYCKYCWRACCVYYDANCCARNLRAVLPKISLPALNFSAFLPETNKILTNTNIAEQALTEINNCTHIKYVPMYILICYHKVLRYKHRILYFCNYNRIH